MLKHATNTRPQDDDLMHLPAPESGFFGSQSGRLQHRIAKVQRVGSQTSSCECEYEEDGPAKIGHYTAATIVIGEMIGAGILTLPSAFSKLGWFWGVFFLTFNTFVFWTLGHFMQTAFMLYPSSEGLGELGLNLFGRPLVRKLVEFFFLLYALFASSGYLVGAAESLAMAFFGTELCGIAWEAILVCALAFPLQLRSFGEQKALLWINVAALAVAILIALVFMGMGMQAHHKEEPNIDTSLWLPETSNWQDILMAVSQITFAYCSAFFYPTIMHSMKEPARFTASINIVGTAVFVIYLLVACVGYAYGGQGMSGMITAAINYKTHPGWFAVANALLVFHLCVAYLIFSVVSLRVIVGYLSPGVLNSTSCFSPTWLVASLFVLAATFLVANAIPMFDNITAIIGGLVAPIIGYLVPALYFVKAKPFRSACGEALQWTEICLVLLIPIVLIPAGTTANMIIFIQDLAASHTQLFQCNMVSYAQMQH